MVYEIRTGYLVTKIFRAIPAHEGFGETLLVAARDQKTARKVLKEDFPREVYRLSPGDITKIQMPPFFSLEERIQIQRKHLLGESVFIKTLK